MSVVMEKNLTAVEPEQVNYLNVRKTISSWIFTGDHKRIAMMYMVLISLFFMVGGIAASLIRLELTSPHGTLFASETYNKLFTTHGIVMVFFFLVPSIPATLGNFMVPIMVGARDLAFPRLNLLSHYLYVAAGLIATTAMLMGGVDTGWTFYTPYSSVYSNGQVFITIVAIFLAGFSSIATGLNFIVTIHKMRAPGLTWDKLPLFIWAHYATSVIIMLGTPVVAITLALVAVERVFPIGIFDPATGGDPILFQHLFWFYSHPAVYIMILPGMGVISEIISTFCRRPIFGYKVVAFSTIAIAALGFMVWGHHMFITGQSVYSGVVFSLISFVVAVPSAAKVFNWTATIYKGKVTFAAPMIYAICFLGLFTIGGLTGLFLAALTVDVHLNMTYFVVAHFHYVMVGGAIFGFLGGLHYWWPKMTGRMYPEIPAKIGAVIIFVGFNLTFFPQFILGFLGNPRRYHYYPEEWQFWHIMSTSGASILGLGYLIPAFYLTWSFFKGAKASSNPWDSRGLEWQTQSPPVTENFPVIPIVTDETYEYEDYANDSGDHDGFGTKVVSPTPAGG